MPGMNPLSNKNMKVNSPSTQPAANPMSGAPQMQLPGGVPNQAQLVQKNAALTREQNLANIQSKTPPAVSQKPMPVQSKGRALGRSGMSPNMPNGRPYPQLSMMEPRPFKVK